MARLAIGTGPCPGWAVSYQAVATGTAAGPDPGPPPGPDEDGRARRSGDDLLLLYTGGTTGMPKGVMWPHHDLREVGLSALRKLVFRLRDDLDRAAAAA